MWGWGWGGWVTQAWTTLAVGAACQWHKGWEHQLLPGWLQGHEDHVQTAPAQPEGTVGVGEGLKGVDSPRAAAR